MMPRPPFPLWATVRCASFRARRRAAGDGREPVNENFSLIVMCLFLLASLAFLAEQLTAYH